MNKYPPLLKHLLNRKQNYQTQKSSARNHSPFEQENNLNVKNSYMTAKGKNTSKGRFSDDDESDERATSNSYRNEYALKPIKTSNTVGLKRNETYNSFNNKTAELNSNTTKEHLFRVTDKTNTNVDNYNSKHYDNQKSGEQLN